MSKAPPIVSKTFFYDKNYKQPINGLIFLITDESKKYDKLASYIFKKCLLEGYSLNKATKREIKEAVTDKLLYGMTWRFDNNQSLVLIKYLATKEDALIATLCHEMLHVVLDHELSVKSTKKITPKANERICQAHDYLFMQVLSKFGSTSFQQYRYEILVDDRKF